MLGALLGTRPDRRTTVVNRSDTPEALTRLSEIGVDQLVIPEDQLGPLSGQAAQVTFTERFDVVNGEGRAMHAVMADAALADRLTATDDPVLNAHLVVADLATLFFDRPNTARGAVLAVPADLNVPEATYDALLSSLARPSVDAGNAAGGHQIIAPMTLDDLFDATQTATSTSRNAPLVRSYNADAPHGLGSLLDSVRRDPCAHLVVRDDRRGRGPGATRIPPLDRQVLIAESAGLDDDTRQAYFAGVGASIDGQLAGIVTPADQRVTLTDRGGDIPLTIENQLDYPVDVKVVLTSAKLDFPDGNVRTVTLPPATPTQVDVAVDGQSLRRVPPRRLGPIARRRDLARYRPLHRAFHGDFGRGPVLVDRGRRVPVAVVGSPLAQHPARPPLGLDRASEHAGSAHGRWTPTSPRRPRREPKPV